MQSRLFEISAWRLPIDASVQSVFFEISAERLPAEGDETEDIGPWACRGLFNYRSFHIFSLRLVKMVWVFLSRLP